MDASPSGFVLQIVMSVVENFIVISEVGLLRLLSDDLVLGCNWVDVARLSELNETLHGALGLLV